MFCSWLFKETKHFTIGMVTGSRKCSRFPDKKDIFWYRILYLWYDILLWYHEIKCVRFFCQNWPPFISRINSQRNKPITHQSSPIAHHPSLFTFLEGRCNGRQWARGVDWSMLQRSNLKKENLKMWFSNQLKLVGWVFFGQAISPHCNVNSDQMSQSSQVSGGHSVVLWRLWLSVVPDKPTKGQGHLLICSRQIKRSLRSN